MMPTVVEVNARTVYEFTGSPSPDFIDRVMDTLLNENVENAFQDISSRLKEGGIALETILKNIYLKVMENRMASEQQTFLVNRLGDI